MRSVHFLNSKPPSPVFADLKKGDLFTTTELGGLFIKTDNNFATCIVPVNSPIAVEAGNCVCWAAGNPVVRVTNRFEVTP